MCARARACMCVYVCTHSDAYIFVRACVRAHECASVICCENKTSMVHGNQASIEYQLHKVMFLSILIGFAIRGVVQTYFVESPIAQLLSSDAVF